MKKEIINIIQSIAGGRSVYNVFGDWVEMVSLSFGNSVDMRADREQKYLELARKYDKSQLKELTRALSCLILASEEKMEDILGYIYMHLELSSRHTGQFFTPYHICQLVASFRDIDAIDGCMKVSEPSCGAGGNIIALAERLNSAGINYQHILMVTCQDLDWVAVHMCYVQMCIYGIPAKVIQGDSLGKDTRRDTFVTKEYKILSNYLGRGVDDKID